jgi:ribose transport system permease protein
MPKPSFRLTTPIVVLMAVMVLWIILFALQRRFLSGDNLQNIMLQMAVQGVIGVGAVIVILTGGIDLSVGSMVGLINIIMAWMIAQTSLPVGVAMPLVLLLAVVIGLINGILIFDLRLPPFIATLGMMSVVRGATLLITGGQNVSNLPKYVSRIAGGEFLCIPYLFWILVGVVVCAEVFLRRTSFGRYTYALGSNQEAARLSGVNTRMVTYGVYMIAGFLGGVAGCMETARLNMGVPTTGNMYELDAIAAAVLGGASLTGAEGTAMGAFVGALLITTIYNGIVMLGTLTINGELVQIDANWTKVVVGVILIITVAVDQLRKRRAGE